MALLLRIAFVTALVLLCTLLPFLPGRHDALAVPLSAMAQVVGTAGLVLVPVGALWLAAERSRRLARVRFAVALLALIASSLVWALASLVAAMHAGFALGLLALGAWVYAASRAWPRHRRPAGEEGAPHGLAGAGMGPPAAALRPERIRLAALLVAVPVLAALLQAVLVGRAVELSRDRAIRNGAPLIAAIERYRAANGRYPPSLLAVNADFRPGVIGIAAYHYEPSGDAYNLFFEQFTYILGTREFVVYNPRDEHVMTSHALDLLELTPEELALERRRGHYAVHAARHAHWKYFWFD